MLGSCLHRLVTLDNEGRKKLRIEEQEYDINPPKCNTRKYENCQGSRGRELVGVCIALVGRLKLYTPPGKTRNFGGKTTFSTGRNGRGKK